MNTFSGFPETEMDEQISRGSEDDGAESVHGDHHRNERSCA
jgi:hypothetical protein